MQTKTRHHSGLIYVNSPVVLGMTFLCLALVLADMLFQGAPNRMLAVYYTSWKDPMMYVRLFTHVLMHANMSHYTGNFLLILAVGPMVEEKYGSRRLLLMIAVTALVTGLLNVVFFKQVMLLGASGVVFMLILLASFTNIREGGLPLTVLLVALLYLGNEVVQGIVSDDNISRISHVAGGFCGAGFGFHFHRSLIQRK